MTDEPSMDLVVPQITAAHLAPVMSDDEIDRTYRVAKALALSGMFKDARQAEQAFAKIILGRELGMSAAQSMIGIYIVEGKPQVASTMLAAFVRSRPEYDYKVTQLDTDGCSIDFYRSGEMVGTSTFTAEDAKTAGLAGKKTYQAWGRNMFFARAMSNGVKWYAPDATNGLPVYVEGEVEEATLVNGGQGHVIEAPAPEDFVRDPEPEDADVVSQVDMERVAELEAEATALDEQSDELGADEARAEAQALRDQIAGA